MWRRLKRLLCRHDFRFVANHMYLSRNLCQCKKCEQYLIQHWRAGTYSLVEREDINFRVWGYPASEVKK